MAGVKTQTDTNKKSTEQLAKSMQETGKKATIMGGAIVAGVGGALALCAKKAIEFESAFAGVQKTIDETSTTSYADISKSLKDMSKEMPQSASELSAIAEAGGQLGIKADDIAKFTKTVAMLGDTTNIVSEEAAISLARIAGITNMPISQLENLGSVIVELGNNTKTSEAEIVDFATRIAASASQVGISNAGIMAISATFSSLGINAEAGGTSVSKMLADMQKSVELGGSKLKQFAKVSGMTSSQFQQAFKKDAAGAFNSFLKGLGDVKKNGKSATVILDEMGISESRMVGMLKAGANGHQQLTDNINMSNKAWKDHNALAKEAEVRYGTTESQLKMMRNQIGIAQAEIGEALLPIIRDAAQAIGKVAEAFAGLDPNTKKTIITIGLVVLAVGGFLLVAGIVISAIGTAITLLGFLGTVLGIAAGAFTILCTPVGLVIGAMVALTLMVLNTRDNWIAAFNRVKDETKIIFDNIAKWFENLRETLSHPIQSVINVVKKNSETKAPTRSAKFGTQGKASDSRNAFGSGRISRDGHIAELHQGEKVLSKQEANQYDKGTSSSGVSITVNGMTIREEADITKFAKSLVRELNQQKIIAVGGA